MNTLIGNRVVEKKEIVSKDIGKKIKRARINIGYTQEKLAGIIDCKAATISSYEVGRTAPDIDTVVALALALNIPISSLLEYDDDMNSVLYAIVNFLKQYSKPKQNKILNIMILFEKLINNT